MRTFVYHLPYSPKVFVYANYFLGRVNLVGTNKNVKQIDSNTRFGPVEQERIVGEVILY